MKLENRFTVPVPIEQAWSVLLDVERIAPCMPGATLTSHDGDEFEGKVKVKLGPINLTYGGKARFMSKDDAAHVAVIDGQGKETRGTGTAKALITCRLVDQGESTDVEVDTDLAITGKPAQFGRGVLADVSAKLIDQFAACLSEEIQADVTAAEEPEAPASAAATPAADAAAAGSADSAPQVVSGAGPAPGPSEASADNASSPPVKNAAPAAGASSSPAAARGSALRPARQPAEAIDLLGTAGAPVLKRLAPLAGVVIALVVLVRWLRR